MKDIFIKFKEVILLVGGSLFLVLFWFRQLPIFAGGEEGIPFYNLDKSYHLFAFAWRDFSGGIPKTIDLARIPFFGVLKFLNQNFFSGSVLQAMTFFILIVVGVLSVYYLLKITVIDDFQKSYPGNTKYRLYTKIPLIGAIFYLLNPYSMVQIWGRGLYNQFFPFALLPLFLVLFILGVKKKNFLYGLEALFASFVFSVSFGQPSYIISLWLVIAVYAIFHFLNNRSLQERKYLILYSLAIFILWLLMHSWWIWPLYKTIGETTDRLGNMEYNIGSLIGISKDSPITIVIRLAHKFLFAGIYGNSYLTFPFRLISWLIPLALVFSIGIFKKLDHFKFYVMLFLASLFLVMGTNPPLGGLFLWLFKNISVFQVFRNPYEKIGLVFMIAYTPLFAIGMVRLSVSIAGFLKGLNPKFILLALILLVSGLFSWPMWTGQFAGGIVMNPWIKVPDYYRIADDWIKNRDSSARIIQFPLNPGDGVIYTWENPYRGIEPSEFIFSNSSISRNVEVNKIYYNVLLERLGILQKDAFGPDPDISRSEFRSKNLYEELGKLNVRYIVLHNDIDTVLSGTESYDKISRYLASERNIQKVNSFGQLDIYEVTIPDEIDHVYSPNVKVEYKKHNPTFYSFKIEDAKKPVILNFLELYNPGWELFVDGTKVETHTRVFSYANSWTINKQGAYEGYIKYKPQDYVEEGKRISLITMIILFLATTFIVIKRHK